MTIPHTDIAKFAADLIAAEATRTQIRMITQSYPEATLEDAYAIQRDVIRQKFAQGRHKIGWKIGLTSKAMQLALNIDIPDSGVLLDDMAFGTGSLIPKTRFIQPRIEAEIAFVMKSDLAGDTVTRNDVMEATDYVAPSLEILDTRILRSDPETNKTRTVIDTIADNAANAGIVLGNERHAINAFDLRWCGAIVKKNGAVEETGLGAGVLDDPIESVVWLARRMHEYGDKISAGDIILSGSFVRPIEATPGSIITAEFGTFGSVSIAFEG